MPYHFEKKSKKKFFQKNLTTGPGLLTPHILHQNLKNLKNQKS